MMASSNVTAVCTSPGPPVSQERAFTSPQMARSNGFSLRLMLWYRSLCSLMTSVAVRAAPLSKR